MSHSKRYVLLIFLIQLSACPNALSEPEVPGAKINPVEYLNPTVFLAARLDTSRVSVKSLQKWARHVIQESALTDKESSYAQSYLQGADKCDDWLTAFKEHGGRFIYQFTGPPNIRDHGTFWVSPLAEKGKLEAMRAWIEELAGPPQPGIVVADPCQSVIRNQTVMFASRLQLEVLNRTGAPQRRWAEEAFNEVKDAPLAVVYIQNPMLWNMYPIPKDTPALRDILWVAADVTFEPEPHVRLTACIDDAKTPAEVQREVIEQIAIATRDMNLQPDDAKVFSGLLSPNVAGRKLVIDLDSRSLSQLGRVLLTPWLHEELREKT